MMLSRPTAKFHLRLSVTPWTTTLLTALVAVVFSAGTFAQITGGSISPASATGCTFGSPTPFSVAHMGGTGPFTYQWRLNGAPVLGATAMSILVPSLPGNDGAYTCDVTDLGELPIPIPVNVGTGILVLEIPPFNAVPPTNTVLCGTTGMLMTIGTGTPVLTIAWEEGPTALGPWIPAVGAQVDTPVAIPVVGLKSTLTVSPAMTGVFYRSIVSNICGLGLSSHTSAAATFLPDPLPTINCPPDITINAHPSTCDFSYADTAALAAALGGVTASDSGCTPLTITHSGVPAMGPIGPGGSPYLVTFTVTDASMQTATCDVLLTIVDVTPPTFTAVPPGGTIQCGTFFGPPFAMGNPFAGSASASDTCDGPIVPTAMTSSVPGVPCAPLAIWTRVFTATDAAGNTATASQVVTVVDTTPPVFFPAPPPTATVSCSPMGPLAAAATVSPPIGVADSCGGPFFGATIGLPVDVVTVPGCIATVTRTYTATDCAGNTATVSMLITVSDMLPPVFDAFPATATVECLSDVAALPNPTATDNCALSGGLVGPKAAGALMGGGCGGTVTVTWTASDGCGNTATLSQVVTVNDITPPVVTGGPSGVTVQCDMVPAPAPMSVIATDNCGPVLVSSTDIIRMGPCADTYVITRQYKVEDVCGNSAQHVQTIVVQDTTPPVLTGVPTPASITASCSAVPTAPSVTAADNCDNTGGVGNPITVVFVETTAAGSCTGNYTLTRTWTAVDRCGNSSQGAQTIAVTDTAGPSIAVSDVCMTCGDNEAPGAGNPSGIAVATEPAGCSTVSSLTFVDVRTDAGCVASSSCSGAKVATLISRTWTATDSCGNTSSVLQTIRLVDMTPPTLACSATPATITLNAMCTGTVPDVVTGGQAVATDNCSTPSRLIVSQAPVAGSTTTGKGILTIVVTAQDLCGNTATCSVSVDRLDVTPPVLTGCVTTVNRVTDAGSCSSSATLAVPMATDGCGPMGLTVTASASAPFPKGTTVVVWTATDMSSNTSTCSTTVIVTDNQLPTITCPPNVTANTDVGSCAATILPAGLGLALATDNCLAMLTVTNNAPMSNSYPKGTTIVTWTATDMQGNTRTCLQTVTVTDIQPPTVGCPPNLTVNTDPGVCVATVNYLVAVGDNCPMPTTAAVPAGNSFPKGTTTVVVTATDMAGNTATCNFTVTVNDVQPPTLTTPGNLTVQCGMPTDPASLMSFATATDNCPPPPTVGFSQTTIIGGGSTCPVIETITRVWLATDAMGNTATSAQTITVIDTTPPTVSCSACPTGVTVASNAMCVGTAPNFTGCVTATDVCQGPILMPVVTQSPASGSALPSGLGPKTITLSVADACGNIGTCAVTVTVVDTTAPTIACPANQTVAATINAVGAINCKGTLLNYVGLTSATDGCPGTVTVAQSPASGTMINLGPNTVTMTATDAAGKTATCSFTVTVTDQMNPTITCPPAMTLAAGSGPPCTASIPNVATTATASDNCLGVVKSQLPAAGTTVGLGLTTVVVTATDGAGRTATCSVAITVTDQTPPTIVCPAAPPAIAANANCQAVLPSVFAVSATDNCAGTVTLVQSPTAGLIVGLGNHTIVITGTDAAGITATCSVVIAVTDQTSPLMTCPTSVPPVAADAMCLGTIPNLSGLVTTSDNCGPITVTQRPTAGSTAALGTYTVVMTASDGAGNTSSCNISIDVTDQTAPTLTCAPAPAPISANASCQAAIPNLVTGSTATDNCSAVTLSQAPPATTIVGVGTHTVVVTATDLAGNTSTCSRNVVVNDTTPPTVTCPAAQTLAANATCMAAIPNVALTATATDNCPGVLKSQSPTAGMMVALGLTTVVVTATDVGGLTATCSVAITVTDQTNPTIICGAGPAPLPAGPTCTASVPNLTSSVTTADNCGPITVSQSPAAMTSVGLGTHSVTMTATDGAGRTATCSISITVVDQTAPTITCPAPPAPVAVGASCQVPLPGILGTAADNCGTPTVTQSPVAGTMVGNGTHTVTLTATDGAGLTATCSVVVTVQDLTGPVVTCPTSMTVNVDAGTCNTAVVNYTGSASDNCDGPRPVSFSPASGSTFALGTTTVTMTSSDLSGNSSTCSFVVTVADNQPPTITCPLNLRVDAPRGACSTIVTFPAPTATDLCSNPVTIVCVPASGTSFASGETLVTCTATDSAGNSAVCTFEVRVVADFKPVANYATNSSPVDTLAGFFGTGTGGTPLAAAGDFNRDIAVLNSGGTLQILFNDGLTDFDTLMAFTHTFAAGETPVAMTMGNFGGTAGNADFAVLLRTTTNNGIVRVLDNTGTALVPIELVALSLTSLEPIAIASGDINGSGNDDLIAICKGTPFAFNDYSVTIILDAMGPGSLHGLGASAAPTDVVICDLDLDGDGDAAIANEIGGIHLLRNNSGSLANVGVLAGPGSSSPFRLCCADMDANQIANDLVLLSNRFAPINSVVSVYINTGASILSAASFGGPTHHASGVTGVAVACGDILGDSIPNGPPGTFPALLCAQDVVIVRDDAGTDPFTQFLGYDCPTGSFDLQVDCDFPDEPTDVIMADLNGDGLPDIVVANSGNNTVSVLCSVMRALGDCYGTGCNGFLVSPPLISAPALPVHGTTANVMLSNATPSSLAILGAAGGPTLASVGAPCNLYLLPPVFLLPSPLGLVTSPTGTANFLIGIPAAPMFTGASIYFQWAIVDGSGMTGFAMTKGLRMRIGF